MKKLICISLIIFLGLVAVGTHLASRKQLWTDELFSQTNIEQQSLLRLFAPKTQEGNPCPLFYATQKVYFMAIHYRFPIQWNQEFCIYEPLSQIIIRFPSIIYMSLGLTIIFLIFARYYSFSAGMLALGLALCNPMIWLYWAEARPYALWFLLTVIQASLILRLILKPSGKYFNCLYLIHILLSLTIVFSFTQIILGSLISWFVDKRQQTKIIGTWAITLGISYFYWSITKNIIPCLSSHFLGTITTIPHDLSSESLLLLKQLSLYVTGIALPWTWILPLGIYPLLIIDSPPSFRPFKSEIISKESLIFFLNVLFLCLCAFLIIVFFTVTETLGMVKGDSYGIPNRYFIFLVPFVVFSLVLCGVNMVRKIHDPLFKAIIVAAYTGAMITTALHTFSYIKSMGLY